MTTLNRIYVSDEVDLRLRNLKARTGLTPNLLCRLGFCLSLDEPGIPDPRLYGEGNSREFNRYTLTGQWDLFFFSLLRERLLQDGLDPETDLEEQFKGHLSRGVLLLLRTTEEPGGPVGPGRRSKTKSGGRMNIPRHPVYMDHHATTPVDPRVLEAMLPYFSQCFGNAASIDHEHGTEVLERLSDPG